MRETALPFHDRCDAGRRLAEALAGYAERPDEAVVLGLPRGGVVVGFEVASAHGIPLDVFLVRKIGAPGQEELALGAIASGGVRVLNEQIVATLGMSVEAIDALTERARAELERGESAYRNGAPPVDLAGRTVILVDDGLATGATMMAATKAVRQRGPQRLVIAVPVGADETCRLVDRQADEMVCLAMPEPFGGVGRWYERFDQTTDDEVRRLLEQARADIAA